MTRANDWFGSQGVQGYQPGGSFERAMMPQGGGMNEAGAANDPFAYTGGSLLTPWTKKFEAPAGSGGGYTPPQLSKFDFGQARAGSVGRIQGPKEFSYGDFVAPDAETFKQDPGYAFRLKEGQRALENSAAARGTLLTGATAKALANYGQEAASQEYGNAFGRALTSYQTNRGNAAENWDRNWGASLATQRGNIDAANMDNQTGLSVWDRNLNLARTQWQDDANAAQAAASAAASNSAQSYSRALGEYKMEHDIFQENQQNQFGRLMAMAGIGQGAAGQAGAYGSSYGANAGNIYGQAANAQAAGQMGSANAWSQAMGNAANAMGSYAAWQAAPNYFGGY